MGPLHQAQGVGTRCFGDEQPLGWLMVEERCVARFVELSPAGLGPGRKPERLQTLLPRVFRHGRWGVIRHASKSDAPIGQCFKSLGQFATHLEGVDPSRTGFERVAGQQLAHRLAFLAGWGMAHHIGAKAPYSVKPSAKSGSAAESQCSPPPALLQGQLEVERPW